MAEFVGRSDELAVLEALQRASFDREGATAALIVGEPGIGKSRLLREATRSLRPERHFSISGHEPERVVPLAAAAPLLRGLSETPGTGELLSDLLLTGGSAGSSLEPIRLFEVAHRCLDSSPATLSIDDVQWLDEMTVALCHYLIRAASRSLLVLAASRPTSEADGFGAALSETLGEHFARIELGPLDRDEAERLLRDIRGDVDDRSATEMWRRAKGSPFWLESLASATAAESMNDAIRNRLWGLTDDASRALMVLAVVGRPLLVDEAAALLGWPAERVRHVTDELTKRGLAVSTMGECRIAHDLIRDSLLATLSSTLARPIHEAFADLLESRANGDMRMLHEALEHRHNAGMPSLDLALRIARSPQRRLVGGDGLRLLTTIADEAGAAGLDLQWEVATIASDIGEHRTALDRWTMLADRLPDARRRAEALLAASRAASELDEVTQSLDLVRRARGQAPDEVMFQITLDSHEATVLRWQANRLAEADKLTERALASARRLIADADIATLGVMERRAYLDALQSGFEAAFPANRPTESLMLTEEMLRAATDDEVAYLKAAHVNGACLVWNGRLREGADRLRYVWTRARRLALPGLATDSGHSLGNVLHDLGELREAGAVLDEARKIGHRLGFQPGATWAMQQFVRAALGEWRKAADALEADAARETNPHSRLGIYESHATFLVRYDESPDAARVMELLAAAMTDLEETGCRRCGRELLLRSAEAYIRIGRVEEARRCLEREDAHEEPGEPGSAVWRAHAEGLLSHAEGDLERAETQLEDAIAHAQRMGLVMDELQVMLDLAAVLEGTDRKRATALLEDAAARAENIGAVTLQALAERRLRKLGVRTWRRSLSEPGDALHVLTGREREVARLAAEGAKNAEIAQALFLSPKTVERHLSNVFVKLGVRNRAELSSRHAAALAGADTQD